MLAPRVGLSRQSLQTICHLNPLIRPRVATRHTTRHHTNKPNVSDSPNPLRRTWQWATTPSEKFDRINRSLLRWASRVLAVFLAGHIFFKYFYIVEGSWGISMLPTIASSGDWLLISKYYRKGRGIAVGDIISFHSPLVEGEYAVKRLIGLPGDFVLRDTPGHSSAMIQIPEGHCWVVGDNLTWSRDSRIYGPLPLALVNGKVLMKWSNWWKGPEKMKHGLQTAVPEDDVD